METVPTSNYVFGYMSILSSASWKIGSPREWVHSWMNVDMMWNQARLKIAQENGVDLPREKNAMALAYTSLSAHPSDPLTKIYLGLIPVPTSLAPGVVQQWAIVSSSRKKSHRWWSSRQQQHNNRQVWWWAVISVKEDYVLWQSVKNTVSRHSVSQDIIQAIADLLFPTSPLIQYMNEVVSIDWAAQFLMSEIYCPRVHGKQQ